jgi:hypothetical protein
MVAAGLFHVVRLDYDGRHGHSAVYDAEHTCVTRGLATAQTDLVDVLACIFAGVYVYIYVYTYIYI